MRKKDTLAQIDEKAEEIARLIEEIREEARKALEEHDEGKTDEDPQE